jgi:toxin ParE1/3/4
MKLRFTPRAIDNLTEIAEYFAEHNPAAGLRVRDDIYVALQNLILFPKAGRSQKLAGLRKFVSGKYAYLIYYVADEAAGEIVVLNLKHPARARDHEDR